MRCVRRTSRCGSTNLPGHWFFQAALAAANGQAGERQVAANALRELVRLRSEFASIVRGEFAKWWPPEYVEHFIDGLRKAGL
jgi:hypothetical protein